MSKSRSYIICFIKGVTLILTLPETTFVDSHFKRMKTINEKLCWDECEKELACNSISFFYSEFLNGDNCLLYTNESPKTIKTEKFVSLIRKPRSI